MLWRVPNPERGESERQSADERCVLRKLANVFIPLIPAFIASGLITGIINIILNVRISSAMLLSTNPNLLGLMGIFGSAVFAIMNIPGWRQYRESLWRIAGVRRRDGGDPFQPATGADYALWREVFQPGRGGVIAVLLVVALMCWIERQFRKLPAAGVNS